MGELNMRHSHATHDLYNRIRDGNPPVWTWYVQTMPVSADPAEVGFDPLDDTKVIPCLSQASCYADSHGGADAAADVTSLALCRERCIVAKCEPACCDHAAIRSV